MTLVNGNVVIVQWSFINI